MTLVPIVLAIVLSANAAPAQQATIDDAIRQLRADDAFRAVLTLNDVIAQNPANGRLVARAQALRAMAYLAQNQPERAKAAADLAMKADPSFVPAPGELNAATIALFESAKSPAPANPEAAGQAAEQAGQFQQAFLSYLSAYQALPNPAPVNDDRRLRERIIGVVQKLGTAPIVPREATDHARKADELIQAEAVLGGSAGASSQSAAAELRQAVRIAPWWPEATFKLATTLQKLERVDEALMNLTLYKLADPNGYAAALSRTAAPPAPTSGAARAVPVLKTGTGSVVIYRLSKFVGGAARAKVDCNGVRMAELQNGRIVTFTAPAGKQTIKVQGNDEFVLDVQAGAEYFFKGSVGMTSFNVRPVSPEEAKAEFKEHNLKPNDAKRTQSSECRPASVQPRK